MLTVENSARLAVGVCQGGTPLEQRIDDDAVREKLSEGAFSLTSTSVS